MCSAWGHGGNWWLSVDWGRGGSVSNSFSTRWSTPFHRPGEVSADFPNEFQNASAEFSGMDSLYRMSIARLYGATSRILSEIGDEISYRLCGDMLLLQLQSLVFQFVPSDCTARKYTRSPWTICLERRRHSLMEGIARVTKRIKCRRFTGIVPSPMRHPWLKFWKHSSWKRQSSQNNIEVDSGDY